MLFLKYFSCLPNKIINRFENSEISFSCYVFTFLCVITLRNFLEGLTQNGLTYFNGQTDFFVYNILHFSLAYISGVISLALLSYTFLRISISNILRVLMPSFLLLLLAPIVDLIAYYGQNGMVTYMYLGMLKNYNLVNLFFTFFGSYPGITFGMRIEIVLALVGLFFYAYIKARNIYVSLLFAFASYTLIFIYCCAPYFAIYIPWYLGYQVHYSSFLMIKFYLIVIMLTAPWLAYLADKQIFMSILKDFRWLRLSHYVLMLVFGAVIGKLYSSNLYSTLPYEIFTQRFTLNFIFSIISITFASLFTIIINNISDQAIDRISNQARPHIVGNIPTAIYSNIAFVSLLIAFVYASQAGVKALLIISVIIMNYYIYSMPPLRLKELPILSKLVISANSLALIILGYILIAGHISRFPRALIFIYLIGVTLCANIIDIKDYAGDKACAIKTLPVLIGLPFAKCLIGIAFMLTYISFYSLVSGIQFGVLIGIAGAIQFYLITKNNYDEKSVFIFYLASMAVFIFGLYQGYWHTYQ